MRTKYDIKRFTSSEDQDFVDALNIYNIETDVHIYTNSNDIAYWMEHCKDYQPDELFFVGFYINNRIAGFAQFVYISEEEIIFIDYMVISKHRRGNNSFYEFVSQLKDFIERSNIHFNYVVVEYPFMNHGSDEPADDAKRIIRLLKMQSFGVIRAPYYQPAHGLGNQESSMKAFLLIYSKNNLKEIRTETYLTIVSALLYKHYYRWYEKIEKNIDQYRKHLDSIYRQISAELGKKKLLKINGYKREEAPPRPPPETKVPYALFALFITLSTMAMAIINHYSQLSVIGVVVFWLLSLVSFFAIVAAFGNSKAEKVFNSLLKSFNRAFGKVK